MLLYILKRLAQAVPVLLGTTLLIYFLVFSLPGDPVAALFGDRPPSPAQLAQVRAQYHLDEPFIVQYLIYLGGIFRGDLGVSFSGEPVADILARTFPVTLRLAVLALLFETVIGIAVGLVSGLRKGKLFDASSLVVSLILISLPIFVVAFVAQYAFGVWLGWVRPTVSPGAPWGDLVLPAIVLASISFAQIVRLTRSSVIDAAGLDYVRTARARGLSGRRVVGAHILRNSLLPVVTYLATDFGVLLVGATVTEGIFNVPGVGNALYRAILQGQGPTVVSFVTVMVLIYLVVNLIVDLLYAVLDPRIRYAR
ncbi:ABC transporter permease [Leifsonia xyli subsp. xyli]|uniref:ABC transporter, permease protein n=2 Tax=Leifsonia xyli subsp. xyli TaxID=59736 RepID=Q6ADX7_LEIXX|nr:ABC transporter permease [Leifsonia xyli]AAT89419.1 ABC transporter, permease protein [Leifsonia xyli subsp. xyli str. CTCB07]ODA90579.1 ABC transporter permease [Leifsonia xyli subsp. xyli]